MAHIITYFRNFAENKPHHCSVETAISRIRTGAIRDLIEQLRSITDKDEAKLFKRNNLPCILFAGKFTKRNDAGLEQHSGLMVMDFDHVNVEHYKAELAKLPYIYAAFVSPSGDGVKAVARIPANGERHRGHFRAMQAAIEHLPGFDPTSINVSRICFESYDPEIYVNTGAVEFDCYLDEQPKVTAQPASTRKAIVTDYAKLNNAVLMVAGAADGQKHATLLKAARLCGGYVAAGQVDEQDAIEALRKTISTKDVSDMRQAMKTIANGLEYGKNAPLPHDEVSLLDDDFSFVSEQQDEADYLQQVRTQTLPQGLNTGYPEFDKYFRFKNGNLVIVNGHDNVGKSSFLWYLAVLANALHGWKWIMYCAENTEPQVRKSLMQYRAGKALHEMNHVEYEYYTKWAYDNFTIIKSERIVTAHELLMMGQKLVARSYHHAFMIDPYNALDIDLENTKLNSHEYHYRVTSEFRAFCKRNKTAIYLNCHAVTEALRRTHKDGPYTNYPMPPNKADTEGGGKFANRADDFLTIHRYTQHPTDFNLTEIHVRKIKETETGGRPTLKDDPIRFKMERGIHGFFEPTTGFNPLVSEEMKQKRAAQQVQRLVFKEEEPIMEELPDPGDPPF